MNSKFLFYKEAEARSLYFHTGRKMPTFAGKKAQFERVPINNFTLCRKTTPQVNTLHMGQTKVFNLNSIFCMWATVKVIFEHCVIFLHV
jgi:hypothetical protein